MPNYSRLQDEPAITRKRIARKLKTLRERLRGELPTQTTDKSLILGTWNIRNFDDNRFGHGPRLAESFYYMAETIAAFDVIAIQELTRDLAPLDRLMGVLGPEYRYIVTDVTEGRPGNTERLGVIYNRHKVTFRGMAGEVVLPERLLISDVTKRRQFSRTPFACSFESGWFRFVMATVHIYFGSKGKTTTQYARRVAEIESVARFLSKRSKDEEENYVLVGDFNIEDFQAKTFNALEKFGFEVFKNKEGSNRKQNRFYDQIGFRAREGELRLAEGDRSHGVLNVFESVFRSDEFSVYATEVDRSLARRIEKLETEREKTNSAKKKAKLLKTITTVKSVRASPAKAEHYYADEWRTYQMSDHYPLWVELDIDFTEDYLDRIIS